MQEKNTMTNNKENDSKETEVKKGFTEEENMRFYEMDMQLAELEDNIENGNISESFLKNQQEMRKLGEELTRLLKED